MSISNRWIVKVALMGLLCFGSHLITAQNKEPLPEITYRSQLRFSLAALVYDHLQLTHEGRAHLKSAPTPSGSFTMSYYRHVWNGFGVNVGAGFSLASANMHYNFEAPTTSIFRTNDYFDYEFLYDSYFDYEEQLLVAPLSAHKIIEVNQRQCSLEIGIQLNVMNQDPHYLPARKQQGASYGISDYNPGDNSNFVRLFDSYTDINGDIINLSYFIKLGLIKKLKKERSLTYQLVANWSPKHIREGRYEFYHLGYESKGAIRQNINYLGFEVTYGFALSRRLKNPPRQAESYLPDGN